MKLTSATAPLDDYRIPAPPGAKPRHDYPWASDRFHPGILKGVIALHAGFAVRGINYAFWLDEPATVHRVVQSTMPATAHPPLPGAVMVRVPPVMSPVPKMSSKSPVPPSQVSVPMKLQVVVLS